MPRRFAADVLVFLKAHHGVYTILQYSAPRTTGPALNRQLLLRLQLLTLLA